MTTGTRAEPYVGLRIATAILIAVTFILALAGLYSDGPLSGFSGWPFLISLLLMGVVVSLTIKARRQRG